MFDDMNDNELLAALLYEYKKESNSKMSVLMQVEVLKRLESHAPSPEAE